MIDISELTIESTFKCNVEDAAKRIEYECIDVLRAPIKGIYLINKTLPVMVDGGDYYTIETVNGVIVRTPVLDITNVKSSVYTAATGSDNIALGGDKLVIPKTFMLNKAKYISNEPIVPYRGLKIIEDLINTQINGFIKYRNSNKSNKDIICNNLIEMDEGQLFHYTKTVNEIYKNLEDEITNFLGKRDWYLYFVKLKDTTLTIEQSIDWRAYQYLISQDEQNEKNNQNSSEYLHLGLR